MTRPKKQTVDYFPHSCNHKKTIYILEERYGNNGYSFWFKLLEMLGNTEGQRPFNPGTGGLQRDLGYKYPRKLDLRPDSEFHKKLLLKLVAEIRRDD